MTSFQIKMTAGTAGKKFFIFIISLGICLIAGYIAAYFTMPALSGWYAGLVKPDLTPPSWVFAPVWTILSILMGLSLYFIWQSGTKKKEFTLGLILFLLQIILNVGWSYVFFGLHSIFFGFIGIVLLWVVLVCTIIQLLKFSIGAAVLLLPYLFWLTFAVFLNYTILTLNPVSLSSLV